MAGPIEDRPIEDLTTLERAWRNAPKEEARLNALVEQTLPLLSQNLALNPTAITKKRLKLLTEIADNIHETTQHIRPTLLGVPLKTPYSPSLTNKMQSLDKQLHATLNDIKLEKKIHREYTRSNNPSKLEAKGRAYYDKFLQTQASIYINYALKHLEKAAHLYEKKGNLAKATEIRLSIAQMELFTPENPLMHIDELINQNRGRFQTRFGPMDEGATLNHMDSEQIKKEQWVVRRTLRDGQTQDSYHCKLVAPVADKVRGTMRTFGNPAVQATLEQAQAPHATVKGSTFIYPKRVGDELVDNPESNLPMGDSIVLTFDGIGKVEIGNDSIFGEMYNRVVITVNPENSAENFKKIAAMIGLSQGLCTSSEYDTERLKVNKLLHFYYPRLAASVERDPKYYSMSVEDILNSFEATQPGVKATIERGLSRMNRVEAGRGGRELYVQQGLSAELEGNGFRGFLHGVGSTHVPGAAKAVASIMQTGGVPSQTRCDNGYFSEGASVQLDHIAGSAHYFFTRAVTQKACDANMPISQISLHGVYQIVFAPEAADEMPDCRERDAFGCCNPKHDDFEAYENRPSLDELVNNCEEGAWTQKKSGNEVMFRNGLSPKYITAITYQDHRKEMVNTLATLPNFFPADCVTMQQKVDYISLHYEEVERALTLLLLEEKEIDRKDKFFPPDCVEHADRMNYVKDHYQDALKDVNCFFELQSKGNVLHYKDFPLKEYWLIDPKKALIDELREAGVLTQENEAEILPLIKEQDHLSNAMFAEASTINQKAQSIQATELVQNGKLPSHPHLYIDALRQNLSQQSDEELRALYEPYMQEIGLLQQDCSVRLNNVDFSGRDSLNRQLVTDTGWNDALRDPKVITALFALEAAAKRGVPGTNEEISFMQNTGENARMTDMLYFAFKSQPLALLESLPLNDQETTGYLGAYLKRKDIASTFGSIVGALEVASATRGIPPPEAPPLKRIDRPYTKEVWTNHEVSDMLTGLVQKLEGENRDEALRIKANYNARQLSSQTVGGFQVLCEKMAINPQELTLDEVVQKILTTPHMLHYYVSHLFYDRVHIMAALTDQSEENLIHLKDGPVHVKDLYTALVNHLSTHGVSAENAIVAEQLYIRIAALAAENLNV